MRDSPSRALLLLHGFLGSPEDWEPIIAALPQYRCIAPAIPGDACSHGEIIDSLLALLDSLGIERCAVLGYSMGGRVAMQLALRSPQRVGLLIAESANPGIPDVADRAARVAQDDALADRLAESDLAEFLADWYAQPLFATLSHTQKEALIQKRSQGDPASLAATLRALSVGRQENLWPRLPRLECPVHFIAGALDSRYREIAESAARQAHIIEGAGHNVHLEAPGDFCRVLTALLEKEWPASV
ncbi:MAG: 2-succinyl-6-hydroxy-2,4-cyclohexadiene-1-carboxylate synthase [Rhodothermales bacterium]|jgi:2-succinyl-6-hydroxy-2,4-cyclohexadiene-1-carboxylate synthase